MLLEVDVNSYTTDSHVAALRRIAVAVFAFTAVLGAAVTVRPAKAFDCRDLSDVQRNAKAGDRAAQLSLSKMYFYNECGLSADDATILTLAKHSAEQLYPKAESFLAFLLHKGVGTSRNDVEATRWAWRAAEQGDGGGQVLLADMYIHGAGGLSKDSVEADKWYLLAERHGAANTFESAARALLESSMSPAAITEAKRRAEGWTPMPTVGPPTR